MVWRWRKRRVDFNSHRIDGPRVTIVMQTRSRGKYFFSCLVYHPVSLNSSCVPRVFPLHSLHSQWHSGQHRDSPNLPTNLLVQLFLPSYPKTRLSLPSSGLYNPKYGSRRMGPNISPRRGKENVDTGSSLGNVPRAAGKFWLGG